jgi:hypothetical protein
MATAAVVVQCIYHFGGLRYCVFSCGLHYVCSYSIRHASTQTTQRTPMTGQQVQKCFTTVVWWMHLEQLYVQKGLEVYLEVLMLLCHVLW